MKGHLAGHVSPSINGHWVEEIKQKKNQQNKTKQTKPKQTNKQKNICITKAVDPSLGTKSSLISYNWNFEIVASENSLPKGVFFSNFTNFTMLLNMISLRLACSFDLSFPSSLRFDWQLIDCPTTMDCAPGPLLHCMRARYNWFKGNRYCADNTCSWLDSNVVSPRRDWNRDFRQVDNQSVILIGLDNN